MRGNSRVIQHHAKKNYCGRTDHARGETDCDIGPEFRKAIYTMSVKHQVAALPALWRVGFFAPPGLVARGAYPLSHMAKIIVSIGLLVAWAFTAVAETTTFKNEGLKNETVVALTVEG